MQKIKWILTLKPLKQSLLQNEASFSPPERICRISSAILDTKMKHPNFGPSTRLQEDNSVNAQNASLKSMLLVGSPGDKQYVILSPVLKCFLTSYIYQSNEIKTKSLSKHVMIIILDTFICFKKTLALEITHCTLIIINPLPTIML